jgi:hypothetical protein
VPAHPYLYVAYIFGGIFLENAVPHFVHGVSGRRFPSPFGGMGSPRLNVVWGMFNVLVAYLLLRFSDFDLHEPAHAFALGAGALIFGLLHARRFAERTEGAPGP